MMPSAQASTDLDPIKDTLVDPVGDVPGARQIGFDKARHPNASAILFDNLDRNPDAIAVTGPAGTRTYAELCGDAASWGHALAAAGLARGDRVALFMDDTPSYPAVVMGAIRAGFVPVLLNTQSKPDLLQFYLSDSAARIAVIDAAFSDVMAEVDGASTSLENVIVTNGPAPATGFGSLRAETAHKFTAAHPKSLDCADTGPDDMAFWMYSSGSTGRPKGIVHLQHDMAYTAASYADHILNLKPEDRCFSVPKLFFAYGFGNAITFPFSVGASSVLMPGRPEPQRVLEVIAAYKPTAFFALPTVYTALARHEATTQTDFSSLRLSLSAAEILSEDVFTAWQKATGLDAIEGLGSTELLHIYLSNTQQDKQLGASGKVVPGYEVKLCDPQGTEVPSGEDGVMWVRGHSSAPAYWNRPDKTADTMRCDWIYTGDRFIERGGFYYFQGRADDLIKVSGQWVWPLEVERCLNEADPVHECAVLAHQLADKRMVLRAVVALRQDYTTGAPMRDQLRAHVKERLTPFKAPRLITFVDSLPKTGTGKIDRQALAQTQFSEE